MQRLVVNKQTIATVDSNDPDEERKSLMVEVNRLPDGVYYEVYDSNNELEYAEVKGAAPIQGD